MKSHFYFFLYLFCSLMLAGTGCDSQQNPAVKSDIRKPGSGPATAGSVKFKEGSDYFVFERIRILDNVGFAEPAEAFSILLPKGWRHQAEITWTGPGTSCDGTNQHFRANSADGKFTMEIFPTYVWSWTSNLSMQQFQQNAPASSNCSFGEPLDAEHYLKNVFAPNELKNPKILKVSPNPQVVRLMQESNEQGRQELMRYGAADIRYYQSAVTADLRWSDNTEGIALCGVSIIESEIPNHYNGTSDKQATTQAGQRIVFRYPASQSAQAQRLLTVILGSIRTNPNWKAAVNSFWKNVREQKQIAHIGRIRMIDEQTRAMGNAAINKGNERLKSMDNDLRNWEERQQTQDRIHTNFIKTIREVENYRDETGKIEMVAGYDHAWSRSDGSSFIMSNSPTFDPSAVFLDPNWKEMKKVD